MGVYYQIANLDRQELIDCYSVTDIKFGAFSRWSLQGAIVNTFLGFGWPHFRYDWGQWVGRWRAQRIQIQNDSESDSDERDEEQRNWPDAGMQFLAFLDSRQWLEEWIAYAGWTQEWESMEGTRVLRQWISEHREPVTTRHGGAAEYRKRTRARNSDSRASGNSEEKADDLGDTPDTNPTLDRR